MRKGRLFMFHEDHQFGLDPEPMFIPESDAVAMGYTHLPRITLGEFIQRYKRGRA